MKNLSFKIKKSLFALSVLICVHLWFPWPSAWAQDDALAAPTPVENQLKGTQPKPTAPAKAVTEAEPADVVGQNGETVPMTETASTPAPAVTATPGAAFTKTPTPTPTPKPAKNAKKTPTPNGSMAPKASLTANRTTTPFPTPVLHLPQVTTIPNPAYGDKVIFRVMTAGPAKARIVVYDRFFNKVKGLQGEGEKLFDILWNFKKIPEGIYYYQSQVTDTATGGVQTLKLQSFAVMKDEADPGGD